MTLTYATAAAFRAALKDRLTLLASDSGLTVDELQRQFAYDRALARIFTTPDARSWVLKGAGALLARLERARHSKDVDVYYAENAAEPQDAINALRSALESDIGDHFGYDTTRIVPLQEEARGARLNVTARLGPKPFAAFHIDVVVGAIMTAEPDLVHPLTRIDVPGLVRPNYRAFPVVDHLADKLCATIRTHAAGGEIRGSSRVKDLVDIALIASTHRVPARGLATALAANTAFRGLRMPERFALPDDNAWRRGYPKAAVAMPGVAPTFEEALLLAKALFDPVLAGQADNAAEWNPHLRTWEETMPLNPDQPGDAADTPVPPRST